MDGRLVSRADIRAQDRSTDGAFDSAARNAAGSLVADYLRFWVSPAGAAFGGPPPMLPANR
jgi:hypothetical protein